MSGKAKNFECKNLMELLDDLKTHPEQLLYWKDDDSTKLQTAYFWTDFAYDRYTDIHSISEYLFASKVSYKLDILKYYKESPFGFMIRDETHKKIILSFRGAMKKRDLFSLKQFRDEKKKYLPETESDIDYDYIYDHAHKGFVNHSNIFWAMIQNVLKEGNYKDYDVYLHGHSLGAGCAIILGYYFQQKQYSKIHVRVLGCPPIFKDDFDVKSIDYKHWYTNGDPFIHYMPKIHPKWKLLKSDSSNHNERLDCPEIKPKTSFITNETIKHAVFMDTHFRLIYLRDNLQPFLTNCHKQTANVLKTSHIKSYQKLKKEKILLNFKDKADKYFSRYFMFYQKL